jgi:hypothetical protein
LASYQHRLDRRVQESHVGLELGLEEHGFHSEAVAARERKKEGGLDEKEEEIVDQVGI